MVCLLLGEAQEEENVAYPLSAANGDCRAGRVLMCSPPRSPLSATPAEVAHEDLKWAVSKTAACGSAHSCISHGTCLGQPVCKALSAVGNTAGFVAPTDSAAQCGYCLSSFNGFICFCPTRWALHRADAAPA
jgi:hypothetical protein